MPFPLAAIAMAFAQQAMQSNAQQNTALAESASSYQPPEFNRRRRGLNMGRYGQQQQPQPQQQAGGGNQIEQAFMQQAGRGLSSAASWIGNETPIGTWLLGMTGL